MTATCVSNSLPLSFAGGLNVRRPVCRRRLDGARPPTSPSRDARLSRPDRPGDPSEAVERPAARSALHGGERPGLGRLKRDIAEPAVNDDGRPNAVVARARPWARRNRGRPRAARRVPGARSPCARECPRMPRDRAPPPAPGDLARRRPGMARSIKRIERREQGGLTPRERRVSAAARWVGGVATFPREPCSRPHSPGGRRRGPRACLRRAKALARRPTAVTERVGRTGDPDAGRTIVQMGGCC
jgi:hypothetical protein